MANPTQSTTPNLGLQLFYEGIKIDNDIINSNWNKIDEAFNNFKQIANPIIDGATGHHSHRTVNYSYTDWKELHIELYRSSDSALLATTVFVPQAINNQTISFSGCWYRITINSDKTFSIYYPYTFSNTGGYSTTDSYQLYIYRYA